MTGSRSFSDERPQVEHLVKRRKGGVAGEVKDLRLDIEDAFCRLEGELDSFLEIQDDGVVLHTGKTRLNFAGAGVLLSLDGGDPLKVNVVIPGTGGSATSGALVRTFDFNAYPSYVDIGTVVAGTTIERVSLEIETPFDNSLGLSVGDDVLTTRLMEVEMNYPECDNVYKASSGYLYAADTIVRLYFHGATPPTVGEGRVIVYIA